MIAPALFSRVVIVDSYAGTIDIEKSSLAL
jgi:hypothetical protein